MDRHVCYDVVDRIAYLTLDHPAKRNALSRAMIQEMHESLDRADSDGKAGVVVVRATGPVFSAGHDLRELADADGEALSSLFHACTALMERIRTLAKPVIAQVDGLATAAGCQLAASCDLVVASDHASFATPGIKIGLFCTTPAVPLARAVPAKKALEMLLTGEPLSAREAERVGLVNRVVPSRELADTVVELARRILSASPAVLALGKRAFYEQLPCDFPKAYALAERVMVENAQADDAREGISAFLHKRTPRWAKPTV